MTPTDLPETNAQFGAPKGMMESQVATIRAFWGEIDQGPLEGSEFVVTAWQPSPEEVAAINAGAPIFLTTMGGLPPHLLTTSFREATNL